MKKAWLAVSTAWICLVPCEAIAQDAPSTDAAPDIIVTAQRRAERLQDVPIAITALSAEQLAASGVSDVTKLNTITPGLYIQASTGFVSPHIRGIGTSAGGAGLENSVAVYIDGVYMASQPGSLLSLNNVARIEVLKGPQGTLFGRNATGGLIQIVTQDPTQDFTAKMTAGYGNYDTFTGSAYVAGGIAPNLAADIAGQVTTQGKGYGINVATGNDVYRTKLDLALRSKWVFTPTDATTIKLSLDYERRIGNTSISSKEAPGLVPVFGPAYNIRTWDINADYDPYQRLNGGGASLDIQQDLGGVQLQSITAYRKSEYTIGFDTDLTPTPAQTLTISVLKDRQISQELKLQSEAGSKIQWVVGAFYFNADAELDPNVLRLGGPAIPPPPAPPITGISNYAKLTTRAWAGYGQVTVPLGDRTKLTGGFRYSTERRSIFSTTAATLINGVVINPFGPNTSQHVTFSAPTWRVSLDHKLDDNNMIYASYNRGFKSGGYNARNAAAPAFAQEQLDAYEVGIKSDLFDRLLRVNAAAFYYKYRNIQVSRFELNNIFIYNGAGAEIYGVDLDLQLRPAKGLTIDGGVSVLHDRFTSFPNADRYTPNPLGGSIRSTVSAEGNRLPITPDATVNLNVHYVRETKAGIWSFDLGGYYNSGFFGQPDNVLEQKAYALLDGSIGWKMPDKRYGIRVWGKNLTNKPVTTALGQSDTSAIVQYDAPRTYGITLSADF
ncbi:MAG: TonB-dependent receptor [Candidatus Sphingomonas phytovorans]|nr:TonB-dependent receptor [Sphingomonas sp.]WEK02324.1 MAG: TonB-dependent receptor [Sphingomonas sp.]